MSVHCSSITIHDHQIQLSFLSLVLYIDINGAYHFDLFTGVRTKLCIGWLDCWCWLFVPGLFESVLAHQQGSSGVNLHAYWCICNSRLDWERLAIGRVTLMHKMFHWGGSSLVSHGVSWSNAWVWMFSGLLVTNGSDVAFLVAEVTLCLSKSSFCSIVRCSASMTGRRLIPLVMSVYLIHDLSCWEALHLHFCCFQREQKFTNFLVRQLFLQQQVLLPFLVCYTAD